MHLLGGVRYFVIRLVQSRVRMTWLSEWVGSPWVKSGQVCVSTYCRYRRNQKWSVPIGWTSEPRTAFYWPALEGSQAACTHQQVDEEGSHRNSYPKPLCRFFPLQAKEGRMRWRVEGPRQWWAWLAGIINDNVRAVCANCCHLHHSACLFCGCKAEPFPWQTLFSFQQRHPSNVNVKSYTGKFARVRLCALVWAVTTWWCMYRPVEQCNR